MHIQQPSFGALVLILLAILILGIIIGARWTRRTNSKKTRKLVDAEFAEVRAWRRSVDQQERQQRQREGDLNDREDILDERDRYLVGREAELDQREAAIAKRELLFADRNPSFARGW